MQKQRLAAQLFSRKGADRENILAQLESYPDELEIVSLNEMAEALEKTIGAVWSRVKKLHKNGIRVGIRYHKNCHIYTKEDFQKVKESYEKDYVYPSAAIEKRTVVHSSPQ